MSEPAEIPEELYCVEEKEGGVYVLPCAGGMPHDRAFLLAMEKAGWKAVGRLEEVRP